MVTVWIINRIGKIKKPGGCEVLFLTEGAFFGIVLL